MHVVEDFGRAQQRLGRDAAPVEADAAEIVALDDCRLEAELSGADGGDIAARTGADDHNVETCLSHLSSPACAACSRASVSSAHLQA
jgi:hypothetical protein